MAWGEVMRSLVLDGPPPPGFERYTASNVTRMAIDREKRPFAYTMRWSLMTLAAIALLVVLAWTVVVVV